MGCSSSVLSQTRVGVGEGTRVRVGLGVSEDVGVPVGVRVSEGTGVGVGVMVGVGEGEGTVVTVGGGLACVLDARKMSVSANIKSAKSHPAIENKSERRTRSGIKVSQLLGHLHYNTSDFIRLH